MTPIRASDAERERIAQVLQQAAGDGRLTPEEAGERLAQASAARHRDELASLVSDLPAPAEPERPSRPRRRGSVARAVRGGLRLAILTAVVFMVWRTGAWVFLSFWPLLFVGLAFGMARRARRARWWFGRCEPRWFAFPHRPGRYM